MADICTVAAGSCYGVVVLTTAADILTFRAKTTKSGLVIEQQHSTKLPHTLASPASVSLTPDVLALGTWEHGLWVWQAPFEKKQKKELHGQQLLGDGWEVHAVTSIAPSCVLCCGSDLRVHCFNIGDTAGGSKSSVVHEAAISTITHDAAHNTVISSGLDGLLCVWRLTTSRPRPGGSSNADTPLFAISGPPLLAVEITGRLPIISHCHVGRFLLLVQREDSSHMVSAIELPAAATTTAETQHCTSTSDDTKRATSTMADEGGRASMSLAATTWVLRHVPVQQDVHVFEEPLLQDADGDPSNLDSTAPDESTA
ncbi:hypothetical protein PTSG_00525 [Salpingoeca rosetta]|uniref:Uncharacterized protein n=1 Tax=Salpingoeca rosetta (strain ATCC 50818 / BSB-021) TaxID=946362 RepID=F2TWQ3_SALR5|nr:uncharacterized protein PTSG_00525 [Salpingoeca rosetta]EGD72499.1 hypothetical protein PTSG_00525 [Salpingoeca rosetta]|eukprot:XP_004999068.1 hypothetical protein PTSG_00525 [Salpingoeca rosetta]